MDLSGFANGSSTADASSYTFSAVSFGADDPNRYVACAIAGRRASALSSNSLTLGGVPATKLLENNVDADGGGSMNALAIWLANVPSGATGDIVAGFSAAALRCAYAIGIMYGPNPTAHDTVTAGTTGGGANDTRSGNIDVANGGCVFAVMATSFATYTSAAWTGLTKVVDTTVESALGFTTGYLSNGLIEANRSISCTVTETTGVDQTLAAVSFAPLVYVPLFVHHRQQQGIQ